MNREITFNKLVKFVGENDKTVNFNKMSRF